MAAAPAAAVDGSPAGLIVRAPLIVRVFFIYRLYSSREEFQISTVSAYIVVAAQPSILSRFSCAMLSYVHAGGVCCFQSPRLLRAAGTADGCVMFCWCGDHVTNGVGYARVNERRIGSIDRQQYFSGLRSLQMCAQSSNELYFDLLPVVAVCMAQWSCFRCCKC